MTDLLSVLKPADFRFMASILESPFNISDDASVEKLVSALETDDSEENRLALYEQMESTIRYVGSSDLAFAFRSMTGSEPGVSFPEIIADVARAIDIEPPTSGTDRKRVEKLVTEYATKQFADLPEEEQRKMLEDLGVERDKAEAFLRRSAGVFALPMLIEALSYVVVQGLIKTIIFGTIAKIIGSQLAAKLFAFLVARMPWWVSWIGPAAWTISIGWTAVDLQGAAKRKTIPIVLYLGVCSLRERAAAKTA